MPIQIQSNPAKLSIHTNHASISMRGNGAKPLDIESEIAQVDMESNKPQLKIDQTECFAEAGLKNIKAFMDDAVAYGQQKFSEGVSRIVSDGNSMAAIETGYDPIADQAYQNAYAMFDHEFNYDAIPKSRPQIEVTPGNVNYNYRPAHVQNNTQAQPIQNSYTPGKVEITVKEYGKVDITYDKSSLYYQI